MAPPAVHTVFRDAQGWVNVLEGSSRVLDTHRTKAEASEAGRERARRDRAEHIIHRKDGSIGSRNSYGHDPRRHKG
jgi:Uncharacterized protein conserved in bacteria (DUF2188)